MKKPFIPTMKKTLQEYGVARSDNIVGEARSRGMDIHRLARGYTYTTSDDGFPPTDLACDNPFADNVLEAKNILDFGCGVGRNLPWVAENTDAIYYGLDPNPVMLENFWNVTDIKYNDGGVNLMASFDDIPDGTMFDVVVSTFVMQHLGYRAPAGAMNVTDMTQEIMKYTREGTVWYLLEHEGEEQWFSRWFQENNVEPDVFIQNYEGQPDLLHRGNDAHLMIWRQTYDRG